jgi:asparaginyl-tRNA synthetase
MIQVYSCKQCLAGEAGIDVVVTVRGWVKTRRDSNAGLSFIHLQDGSSITPFQIIAENTLSNYQTDVLNLTTGCSVIATGKLVASQGKGQGVELQATSIEVVGLVQNPESYPISAKRHTLEYLRDVAHLRPRTNTISAMIRIRHRLAQAVHQFFDERGYFWIHTPIITSNDCEGAGELFRVSTLDLMTPPKNDQGQIDFSKDFFGQEAFLTVSGQLNAEAYCLAMSKVYTFGPTFRAENSNTSRHLAEFWMIEPEVAFSTLADMCDLSQALLRHLCKTVLEKCADDMDFFNQFIDKTCIQRLQHIVDSDFEVMTYTQAIKILEQAKTTFQYPVHWGLDLQSEHERYLAEQWCKKPVILTDYPKDIKSFYMRMNDDQETVAAMDVLAPGIGEIIGGSQREERLDLLEQRMVASGIQLDNYQWYLDLRRYGTVPHAGFGLGFERLISYVTGIANVRDVIAFPRTPGNARY